MGKYLVLTSWTTISRDATLPTFPKNAFKLAVHLLHHNSLLAHTHAHTHTHTHTQTRSRQF